MYISAWGTILVKHNFFVHFFGELKIPKRHFKIDWPLGNGNVIFQVWKKTDMTKKTVDADLCCNIEIKVDGKVQWILPKNDTLSQRE